MVSSTSCFVVLALLAAAGAAAQQTGNLAFLAPVRQLPGLAKAGAHLRDNLNMSRSSIGGKALAEDADWCSAFLQSPWSC